jgi:hypothetical protein
MNKFCQSLDIGIPDVLTSFENVCEWYNTWNPKLGIPPIVPKQFINPKFTEFCEAHELVLFRTFFRLTNAQSPSHRVHIDGPSVTDWGRLNWIYGHNDADQIWFELKAGHSMTVIRDWENKENYSVEDDSVTEIYRSKIHTNPTLVNTGILHTAINYSGKDRYLCQVSFLDGDKEISYFKLAEILKAHFV